MSENLQAATGRNDSGNLFTTLQHAVTAGRGIYDSITGRPEQPPAVVATQPSPPAQSAPAASSNVMAYMPIIIGVAFLLVIVGFVFKRK